MLGMNLSMVSNPSQVTVIQQAIAVLRRFGTNAHVYLPGVGMLNGLTAANYLDSAGTTAGTVDQPVGLVLDAAGSLGVELVTNGSGESLTGWTYSGGSGGGGGIASVGGQIVLTVATPLAALADRVTATALTGLRVGASYLASANIRCISGTAARLSVTNGATDGDTTGTYVDNATSSLTAKQFVFVATATTMYQRIISIGAAGNQVAGNALSVREVTGIAASQPTTASKPILRRGAVNQFLQSNAATNAAWFKTGGVAAPSNDTVNLPNLNEAFYNAYTVAAAAASTWTGAFLLSGTGTIYVLTARFTGGSYEETKVKITLTATPTIYAVTHTLLAAQTAMLAGVTRGADGTATTVTFGGGALFQGTYTAQQIQALGGIPTTTTAPASTALGAHFWSFDGSNDSLALGGPLFQMADDHCVVAGARCDSAIGNRGIVSPFLNTGTSAAHSLRFDSGVLKAYWTGDGYVPANSLSDAANSTGLAIVAATRKIGSSLLLKKNGTAIGSVGLSGGTFSAPSTGAIGSTFASDFMNGAIYPVIAIKGTVSDPDLLLLEKFVGSMSGVQI